MHFFFTINCNANIRIPYASLNTIGTQKEYHQHDVDYTALASEAHCNIE